VGLGSTHVEAGQSCNVNVEPMVPIAPTRLFLPDSVLKAFEVEDLRTGRESLITLDQLTVGNLVLGPAEVGLPGAGMGGKGVVMPGSFLTLSVRSLSPRVERLRGAVLGRWA